MAGKGLYYNINKKRKEGRKMRKKGAKGAPKKSDFKRASKTARKRG
jgi:signal recognition particle subunit SEC65|tara:strand:+ start:7643 stop:7780 length:138 start_codon:yes stop_codon:yes gene_type:complete